MSAEGFHFRPVEIPANEVRLMELARVREFRVAYELGESSPQTLLVAELYTFGKPTRVFRLSRAIYPPGKQSSSGTISFGWNRDARHLVCVHDNGRPELYSPFSAKINLPEFSPMDAFYFQDSTAEDRGSESGGVKFRLYPVAGWCGERSLQIRSEGVKSVKDYVAACASAGAKNAVVVYVYRSEYGGDPPMKFEP